MIYSGKAFPHYQGNLFVGYLGGKAILRAVLDGTKPVATETMLLTKYGRIREVVEGPDGFIYFTTSERDIEVKNPSPETDRIMRLVPADGETNVCPEGLLIPCMMIFQYAAERAASLKDFNK